MATSTLVESVDDVTEPALETIGLRKEYGGAVAVEGLTLRVNPGEVFGFLGPNGAGKTTSLKMLLGLIRPTAGSATILGYPLGDLRARRRIGFLPEQFRFHEWMRAGEFLDFHGQLAGVPSAMRRQRIQDTLRLVGIETRQNDRLHEFSKGMLQRIGIAQALINEPDLVFLDEPTSALDPIGRREVRDIIHHLKSRGVTVFLNSHLLSEIEQVCDRVAILDHGRVVREGRLDSLLGQALDLEIEAEPISSSLLDALRPICSDIRVDGRRILATVAGRADIPRVAAAVIAAGADLFRLQSRTVSLEDLFVESVDEGGDR